MEKELAHSFNIRLSSEISEKLKEEQVKLSQEFSERRFYDSSPHLAIASKYVSETATPEFAEALANEFGDDKPWEVEFGDFKVSDTGDYIFLHLSSESKQRFLDLHERAFRVTKDIGMEIMPGTKFRLFPYNPHISIIKLEPADAERALALIEKDFVGIKMPVTSYEITRQTDDEKGFSNFPVINEIKLKI